MNLCSERNVKQGNNLLNLGRNKEACNTDELQFCKGDDLCRQESELIDDVHAKKEHLGQQSELGVYLNQPIEQNPAHQPGEPNSMSIRRASDTQRNRDITKNAKEFGLSENLESFESHDL